MKRILGYILVAPMIIFVLSMLFIVPIYSAIIQKDYKPIICLSLGASFIGGIFVLDSANRRN